jgi:hypothetical protein
MRDGEVSEPLDAKGFGARITQDVAFWRPMIRKLGIQMEK